MVLELSNGALEVLQLIKTSRRVLVVTLEIRRLADQNSSLNGRCLMWRMASTLLSRIPNKAQMVRIGLLGFSTRWVKPFISIALKTSQRAAT